MNKIPSIINCVNCRNVLSSPILLPCGHSVCKCHIDETSQTCMCNQCDILHSECKFYPNKALSNLVDTQLGSIDFGQTYKEAMESCDQLNGLISKIDQLIKDPDNYIYEVFSELRRNVDLKYEEYKLKLDEEIQKIRDELNKIENLCKEKLKSNDLDLIDLRKAKEEAQCELDKHMSVLNLPKVDENKWKEIEQQCKFKIDCLTEKLFKFKESLLLNEFDLESLKSEFIVKIDIDPLFEMNSEKMDSKIINDYKMQTDLMKLCEFWNSGTKFSLLYRGSRDGFRASDFHSKCENKSKTLTIVKSTSECIFGGYTEAEWSSSESDLYKRDPNAFLFSLVNKENQPIKIKVANELAHMAICFNKHEGPKFGGPSGYRDLFIANNSNKNKDSYSKLGNCYKHPKYAKGSLSARNFMAGSFYFQMAEIEVFQI